MPAVFFGSISVVSAQSGLVLAGLIACAVIIAYVCTRRARIGKLLSKLAAISQTVTELKALHGALTGNALLQSTTYNLDTAAEIDTLKQRRQTAFAEFDSVQGIVSQVSAQVKQAQRAWLPPFSQIETRLTAAQAETERTLSALQVVSDDTGKLDTRINQVQTWLVQIAEQVERSHAILDGHDSENAVFTKAAHELKLLEADLPATTNSARTNPVVHYAPVHEKAQQIAAIDRILHQFLKRQTQLETDAKAAIDRADKRLSEMKAAKFEAKLALLPGQSASDQEPTEPQPITLIEGDPSEHMTLARQAMSSALKALHAGEFEDCERNANLTGSHAEEALVLLDRVDSARLEIERDQATIHERLVDIETRITDSSDAYDALLKEFPSAKVESPQVIFAHIRNATGHTRTSLFGIRELYLQQRFLTGSEVLRRMADRLKRMRGSVPDLQIHLQALRECRDRTKQKQTALKQIQEELAKALEASRFSVSEDTLVQCDALSRSPLQLPDNDWVAADKLLGERLDAYTRLHTTVQSAAAAWGLAKSKYEVAKQAVTLAGPEMGSHVCASTAAKFAQAESNVAQAGKLLSRAGSDWVETARLCDTAKSAADQAVKSAEKDLQARDKAMSVYDGALKKRNRLGVFATGSKATAKIKAACKLMDEAEQAVRDRDWTKVLSLSTSANASFQASLNARGMSL